MKFVSLIETTFPSHLAKGGQGKVKESLEERGFFSLLGGFQGSIHPCVEAVGLAARGAFAGMVAGGFPVSNPLDPNI